MQTCGLVFQRWEVRAKLLLYRAATKLQTVYCVLIRLSQTSQSTFPLDQSVPLLLLLSITWKLYLPL